MLEFEFEPHDVIIFQERELELQKEQRRQEENDKLRQEFAQHANAFHQWLQETRYSLVILDGTNTDMMHALHVMSFLLLECFTIFTEVSVHALLCVCVFWCLRVMDSCKLYQSL